MCIAHAVDCHDEAIKFKKRDLQVDFVIQIEIDKIFFKLCSKSAPQVRIEKVLMKLELQSTLQVSIDRIPFKLGSKKCPSRRLDNMSLNLGLACEAEKSCLWLKDISKNWASKFPTLRFI